MPKGADAETAAFLTDRLGPGAAIYLPFLPNARADDAARACRHLKDAGLRPVPHLAARAMASRRELQDWLERLSGAGADAALVVAGDARRPHGPYADSLQLLETGLLQAHGFTGVGFAGHPEGHPRVEDGALWQTLARKADYARAAGLSAWVVTQFFFDAAALERWLKAYEASGVNLPVWVGMPGPTKLRTLLGFALRCGVGASARALASDPEVMLRLAGRWKPDALFSDICDVAAANPGGPVAGVHLFPFGGARQGAGWLAERRGAMASDRDSLHQSRGVR